MMSWIRCAEQSSDAAMSNVVVEVRFAIMAAYSMDFFDCVDFGDVEFVGTDSHYRTYCVAKRIDMISCIFKANMSANSFTIFLMKFMHI